MRTIRTIVQLFLLVIILVTSTNTPAQEDFTVGVRGSKLRLDGFSKDTESGRGFFIRQQVGEKWMIETSVDFFNFQFSQNWGISEQEVTEVTFTSIQDGFFVTQTIDLPMIRDESFTLGGDIDMTMIWFTTYYFIENTSDFKLYVGGGLNYMSTDYEYDRQTFIYDTWMFMPQPGFEFFFPSIGQWVPTENEIQLQNNVTTSLEDKLAPHLAAGFDYALTDFCSLTTSVMYRFDEGDRESKYKAGLRSLFESANWEGASPGIDHLNLGGWSVNLGIELHF